MHWFCSIILGLLGVLAAMEGLSMYSAARSAMHQTTGAVWVAVFAMCVAGIGIMSAARAGHGSQAADLMAIRRHFDRKDEESEALRSEKAKADLEASRAERADHQAEEDAA